MSINQYSLIFIAVVISGFLGGLVSGRLFIAQPALAETALQHQKVIRAETFKVVDSNGKVRGRLDSNALTLFDKNGKTRVRLGLSVDGSPALMFTEDLPGPIQMYLSDEGLEIQDKNSSAGVNLVPTRISFRDGPENERVQLGIFSEKAALQLFDKSKSSRISITAEDEGPLAFLMKSNNEPGLVLVQNTEEVELAYIDKTGKLRLTVYLGEDPGIYINDAYERKRLLQGLTKGQPVFGVFDESESPIWSVP